MLAAGVAALTIRNSSIAQNAVNHADYHLCVTRQKDTEARAANPYKLLDPADPVVTFAKYSDGEFLLCRSARRVRKKSPLRDPLGLLRRPYSTFL